MEPVRERVTVRVTDRDRDIDGDTEAELLPDTLTELDPDNEGVRDCEPDCVGVTEALWLGEDDTDTETEALCDCDCVVDAVPDGVGETDGSRSYRYIVSRYDVASLLQPTIGSSISSAVVRFQATSDSF